MVGLHLPFRQNAEESFHLRLVAAYTFEFRFLIRITGIAREATGDDPQLGSKRNELVTIAAQKLADARMITFDRVSGTFMITDLGRIAAKYYIRYASIEIFNKEFRPKMSEADVLGMLSMSTEVGCVVLHFVAADAGPCPVRPDTSS